MKNEDIHNGLKDKEIRDFLGKELHKAMFSSHGSIEFIEKQIKELKEQLENTKRYEVLKQIISDRGWEGHDISDEIPYHSEKYFPFIGTEEEYKQLMKKIKEAE